MPFPPPAGQTTFPHRLNVALGCILVFLAMGVRPHIGYGQTDSVTLNGVQFDVATGLELADATVAGLTHWPVVADWDREGRLVVVESGGVEWPIAEHNEKRLHRVVRLVDTDQDGVFDERIVAADQLPFTEGVLCLGDDMLVAAPPHILKLSDRDADGICESREVWFDGQTLTGCANDLHGPYLGYDGWVYWCKGAFAEQEHVQIDGTVVVDKAAHIYRRKLSGGPVESVVCGGMDNPVEVAFSAAGDLFFDSTFLQHPRDGKRDGIAHGVYGAVFGKDHAVLDGVRRTGPLAPIMKHLGAAAPSGMLRLSHHANVLPTQPSGYDLIVAEFNLHRVSAHLLSPSRATFRAESQVLLESGRVDFHPTDVLEDGRGGLLVIDTGGWYDLCCPTSRVDQKVASGAIYRLTRKPGQVLGPVPWPVIASPKTSIDWKTQTVGQCMELLRDPRPWIQRGAVLRLVEHENAASLPLSRSVVLTELQARRRLEAAYQQVDDEPKPSLEAEFASDLQQCQRSLQALSLIGTPEALALLARKLDAVEDWRMADQELAILHVLSLHRYQQAESRFQDRLTSRSLRVCRAASEALGRLGTAGNSKRIVEACAAAMQWNPTLRHSVIYALIELHEPEALVQLLTEGNPDQQQTAMEALHRMDCKPGQLEQLRDFVFHAAFAKDTALRVAARDVLLSRPEWAEGAASFLDRFRDDDLTRSRFGDLVQAWRQSPTVAMYTAKLLSNQHASDQDLELFSHWSADPPSPIQAAARTWLQQDVRRIAKIVSRFQLDSHKHRELVASIQAAIHQTTDFETFRHLLSAIPSGTQLSLAEKEFAGWIQRLEEQEEYALLSKLDIPQEKVQSAISEVGNVSANRLADFIVWVASYESDDLDRAMLERLNGVPSARMLDEHVLPNTYQSRSSELKRLAGELNEGLHRLPEDIEKEVQHTLAKLPAGNAVNGLQVFRGTKASCSACHRIGYFGGEVGPDLTHIGKTRTRESLLEAILFPSQRIEQGFRPVKVLTDDGQVYSGIESTESGRLRLQLNAEKSILLDPDTIEQKLPSEVSIMPSGVREQISEQELADLLALLEAAE